MLNIQNYYDMLEKHDWWYYMSDDFSVVIHGQSVQHELKKLAAGKPDWEVLFIGYERYMDSRINGPLLPKPARPA